MSQHDKVATISARLVDPLIFIQEYSLEHGLTVDANGRVSCGKNKESIDTILYYYHLDYDKTKTALMSVGVRTTIPKFSSSQLKGALNVYVAQEQIAQREQLLASLVYDNSTYNGIDIWLMAVTGQVDPLDKYALQHFFWQVKRKMYNKEVIYHLLPILFGEQGGGKSKAIEKLIMPLKQLTLTFNPPEIIDERNYQALSENYINVFDEMSGIETRTDIENFKKNISLPMLSYRPLHTNTNKLVKQNCTFIGSSNKTISQIINDPTGMRRMWQIKCLPQTELQKNWDAINSIDAVKIWKSIDENLDKGYGEDQRAALAAAQKETMNKGEIATFIEEKDIMPGEDGGVYVSAKDVYKMYKVWRETDWKDSKPLSLQYLPSHLETLGVERKNKLINGKKTVCFLVSTTCAAAIGKIYDAGKANRTLALFPGSAV